MGSRYKEEKPFAYYDPEQDRGGQRQAPRAQSSVPTSPREQPFGHYDPDLDREGDRRDTSYGPELRASPSRLDGKGVGRGAPRPPGPPLYLNQDSGYGRGAPEPGYGGRGAPEPGYGGRGAPEPGYGGRGAGYAGRGGALEPGYGGRGAPEPGYGGRGAPEPGYGGRGAPEPEYGGRGAGYAGRGGALEPGYGGRVAPEPGYAGRGAHPAPPNQDFAGASGRGRGYGDGEPRYARPERPGQMEDNPGHGASLGRGRVAPMGAGKYVYGGLQQPERADFEQEYGAPPAPISSEYAHQVYASVFSDPVYGGAGQLNARAGYAEESPELQQLHHKQDVLRHPEQF